jgi:uncharacterized protein (TIGR02246 family)
LIENFTCPYSFGQDARSQAVNAKASTSSIESGPDIDAIRAGSEAFVAAVNSRNAKAVASLWTEQGEYIDDSGRAFAGRNAIEEAYAQFFADNPSTKIRVEIDSLRLLSGVTAIEEGRVIVEPESAAAPGFSRYTALHAKVDGKWQMAMVRDTWVESPAAVRSAMDLQWLIGTWIAEEHGVKTESVCRWVAGDRFLERSYVTTQPDGSKSTGLQLIGWNPQEGHVQSWDFSSTGGHAVGVWYPTQNGWRAEVRGTSGDGIRTAAINYLQRLDDNAYVWQSVQRSLGDTTLLDTDEVIIKRRKEIK